MKKTSKVFGAVACSAALALGCAVPAFAASADKTYTAEVEQATASQGIKDGATASTPVEIATNIEQISVAVPTKLTFVAKSTGGDMLMPTNYHIDNYSNIPIYVKHIKAEYGASQDSQAWVLTNTDSEVAAGKEADANTKRAKVKITMTPNITPPVTPYALDTTGWNDLKAVDKGLAIAAPATAGGSTQLGITLDGDSSVVKNAKTANATPEAAFNIVYTVSASNAAIV